MTIFADDMAFYCPESSATDLQSKLNLDLKAISVWLRDNKLTLNVEKSKFMIIGSSAKLKQLNPIELVFGDEQLGNVSEFQVSWRDYQSTSNLA